MIHEWVNPIIAVLAVLIVSLGLFRRWTLASRNRGGGLLYIVVATLLVVAIGVAGVVWWRKKAAEAMAPER